MRKAIYNEMCGTCVHGGIDREEPMFNAVLCRASLVRECCINCNWASYVPAEGETLIDRILEFRFGYAPKVR